MSLIMLVEDNRHYREGLVEVLEIVGYSVIQAGNGADALSVMRRTKPDLILADEKMPVMTGLELLHTVKKDAQLMTIPFVLMTGHNNPDFINNALQLGADTILIKPVRLDELEATLDNLLNS